LVARRVIHLMIKINLNSFSTDSLLNGSDTSPIIMTIEIRWVNHTTKTWTHTFNTPTSDLGEKKKKTSFSQHLHTDK
jgi:hypothetical protein